MECPPKKVADSGGRVYIGFNETGETFSSSAVVFSGFRSPLKLSQNLCCTSKPKFAFLVVFSAHNSPMN